MSPPGPGSQGDGPRGDGPRGFFALVVERPVAVLMLFIAAAVFGLVSYSNLPLNLMPDISYPTLTVRTEFDGAAPEEVESQVSKVIEEQVATTDGLVRLESRSRAELSDVVLEFDWDTDIDAAAQALRERLQQTWFGDEIGRPLILRYDPSLDPILRITLAMGGDEGDDGRTLLLLRDIAEDEIKQELEAMEGVAAVKVRGGLEREVIVEARETWLAARGVTLEQVRAALSSENVNIAGGSILEGDTEYLIRTLNEFSTLDELRALEIRRPDGMLVPIDEVAVVREAHKEREVVSHLDGREAVELEVFKEADANIVAVARSVKERLGVEAVVIPGMPAAPTVIDGLPDGAVLKVLDDQAAFIEAAISNLRSTAVLGGVLAVVVLFLFLRDFRATVIIATAIPMSIVATFAPMYMGGVSLNLMSLGGLALGIGMLVDNAVVVLESIQVHREAGVPRPAAAVAGVKEVAAAVVASTLTTVAVFFPIVFVEGVAGQIFGDLALAVVFSLLASLVVALVFVPMLAAREVRLPARAGGLRGVAASTRFPSIWELRRSFRRARTRPKWTWLVVLPYILLRFCMRFVLELLLTLWLYPFTWFSWATVWVGRRVVPPLRRLALGSAALFGRAYDRLASRYPALLRAALARPGTVLGLAALALAASWVMLGSAGRELIPEVHQGRFVVAAALPVGTPLQATVDVLEEAERIMARHPEVETVHATIGTERRADSGSDEGEHTARFTLDLVPSGRLGEQEERVMDDLRRALSVIPRLELTMSAPALFSFRTPVEVVVTGRELATLQVLSEQTLAQLESVGGLRDVRSSLVPGFPEIRVRYDRTLLDRFGLSTAAVAGAVKDKVQGARATRIPRGQQREDVVVRLVEGDRGTLADLARINVNPQLDPPIPLFAVATLEHGEGPSEIRRIDQQRAAVISANLEGFDLASTGAAIQQALAGIDWPEGYTFQVAGQNLEMERSLESLRFALLLAVFLVYVIMASTFESLVHPFVILFSLPLAVVGVVAMLLPLGVSLSVVVFIGLIVLAGVVVNNAIVLVDYINRVRRQGTERIAAIERAAMARLRPILITTTTTVLGLVPLAIGLGEGAEIQQPLALTIIAGLTSSTLLTLVVIPVVYKGVTGLLERRGGGA